MTGNIFLCTKFHMISVLANFDRIQMVREIVAFAWISMKRRIIFISKSIYRKVFQERMTQTLRRNHNNISQKKINGRRDLNP